MNFSNVTRIAGGVTVAAALVSCGGGAGELLVASFLGTGGGQFQLESVPRPANYGIFDDTMTVSLSATTVATTAPPDLYATGYDIFISGIAGVLLADCDKKSGRVEGDRVTIAGCFTGSYKTVNRLVSDDGKVVLHHVFDPDLAPGLWVDVNDSSHSLKFNSGNVACEYAGSTKRAATYQRRLAEYSQEQTGDPVTEVTAGIASIVVAGGNTWSGEFIGISGLKLTSGSTTIELQRRDRAPPSACP